jgi:hypothetical protein
MKITISQLLIGVLSIMLAVSCKKETETINFDIGYNYYPDDSGSYVIYKIDSVIYNNFDPNNLKRISSLYLKEIITEDFIDNLGRNAKKIERYTTDSLGHPWKIDRVWYFIKNKTNVEQVEDNIRYIKLLFPMIESNIWKGNKYNLTNHFPFTDLKFTTSNFDWNYRVTGVNGNYTNGNIATDSVVTILQAADSSDVEKVYSLERYARNIGLVYKELWRLDAQLIDNQDYEEHAVFGFILKQSAIKYGKE